MSVVLFILNTSIRPAADADKPLSDGRLTPLLLLDI
jgi:hypothetical protein